MKRRDFRIAVGLVLAFLIATILTSWRSLPPEQVSSLRSFADNVANRISFNETRTRSLHNACKRLGYSHTEEKQTRFTAGGVEVDTLLPRSSCDPIDDPYDSYVREYGRDNLELIRVYDGSCQRLRRFARKLISGEAVKVATLGGSVSAGHGLQFGPPRTRFDERFFDWISDNFPHPGHEMISGAVPGGSIGYFSECWKEHMPLDADLVLTEFDINSLRIDDDFLAFDRLYRSVLSLPGKPALITMSNFGLNYREIAMGSSHSLPMSAYYDIPLISVRNLMFPYLFLHPDDTRSVFWHPDPDPRFEQDNIHINDWGHRVLADGAVTLLRKSICEEERRQQMPSLWEGEHDTRWPGKDILGKVPRLRGFDKWSETDVAPVSDSRCYSMHSNLNPLIPTSMSGFREVEIRDKKALMTEEAGSTIDFELVSSVEGGLGMFFWFTSDMSYGQLMCWVDDLRDFMNVIDGWGPTATGTASWSGFLWEGLPAGRHKLSCEMLEPLPGRGAKFRIVGLTTT